MPAPRSTGSAAPLLRLLRELGIMDAVVLEELGAGRRGAFADASGLVRHLTDRGELTSYQAEQLLRGQGHDLVLGQYVVLEPLGQGGMGQVFKARHQLMKRLVALKVIRDELVSHDQALRRFHREIELAAQLSHPNIVTAFDAEQVGGRHFLAMEYCAGPDLGRLLRQTGPLPVGQACEFVRQVSSGLQHAFERGMIHRDIKPENLLVVGGVVKILDFGLARLRQPEESGSTTGPVTQEGAFVGTPDYTAPEVAREVSTADIRSDLYSLGCTFYHTLAGHVPFPGGTAFEKLLRHQSEEPAPLEQLRADVPAPAVAILRKLMARKPADRYQTPAEAALALARLEVSIGTGSGLPLERAPDESAAFPEAPTPAAPSYPSNIVAAPASSLPTRQQDDAVPPPATPRPRMRSAVGATPLRPPLPAETIAPLAAERRRWPLPISLVVVVAGAVVALGLVAAAIRLVAVLQHAGSAGKNESFASSPELLDPARSAGSHAPPHQRETTQPVAPQWAESLICHPRRFGQITGLAFGPDSETLAMTWEQKVLLWSVTSGKELDPPFVGHTGPAWCVALSPDGKVLASGEGVANPDDITMPGAVRLWNVKTRQLLATLSGHTRGTLGLAFDPGGSCLATAGRDSTVRLWDLKQILTGANTRPAPRLWDEHSPACRTLVGHQGDATAVAFGPDGKVLASASHDKTVRLWDRATGQLLDRRTSGDGGTFYCIAFSRDGKHLAAGTSKYKLTRANPEIFFADVVDGRLRNVAHEREGSTVLGVSFSVDGAVLAATLSDGQVAFWDTVSRKKTDTRAWHGRYPWAVTFSPNGQFLATGGWDGTFQIHHWPLSPTR